jgi:signal transduction histidine kinase
VKRLLPRSLIGQIALVIALVMLALAAVFFIAVQRERQRFSQAQAEGPVIARFVAAADRIVSRGAPGPIDTRRGRFTFAGASNVAPDDADDDLTTRLRDAAAANGLAIQDARAAASDDPPPPPAGMPTDAPRDPRLRSLLLSLQLPDGRWLNGQQGILRPAPGALLRLALATILFYVLLLGAVILVLTRLVRPLGDLTRAAQRFRGAGETPHLTPRGPADIRRATEAFNAMGERVTALMEEKDRMLGAIGHDLRTPLASLRIRAESIEPAEERDRMIDTIEEMAALLDDTLALARSGRSSEPLRQLDVAALADAVVEEFRELAQDVAFDKGERSVAVIRPNLVRRALRNLIDNAVKYAGAASVSVGHDGKRVAIEVADRGPGIPEAQLARVQEAFVRLEESRSRETGGSGLGITLARAAAQLHGGELKLANREGGGLTATLLLPCS